jgi:hypothetical protein
MNSNLMKKGKLYGKIQNTERMTQGDRGRDWSDITANQGTPRTDDSSRN